MKKVTQAKRTTASKRATRVTITIQPAHLELMKKIADRDHDGDLSRAFEALLADQVRFDAMDTFLARSPKPTAEEMARAFVELYGPAARPTRLRRSKKTPKKAA